MAGKLSCAGMSKNIGTNTIAEEDNTPCCVKERGKRERNRYPA